MSNVALVCLVTEERDQFIRDNQWAFKHGALYEFGERNNHVDDEGEIISRKTIETSMDTQGAITYKILTNGEYAGGAIVHIDSKTQINELDILYILPDFHSKDLGHKAWMEIEKLHPETKIWKTCTPYFEKRNIHFYVNKCGFVIDEF